MTRTPLLAAVAVLLSVPALAAENAKDAKGHAEKISEKAANTTSEQVTPKKAAELLDVGPDVLEKFQALPTEFASEKNRITDDKATLGRMLFYENRLSKNQKISCNSCHDLQKYGVDSKKFSSGHKGQLGGRNAPTVYNAGQHIAQFWDGRAEDLEAQATGPMMNPVEMAMSGGEQVVKTLKSMPEYVQLFEKAYPGEKDPVTLQNAALAIAAFERRLVTPSRFDKFLGGDKNALTKEEKQGLLKFAELGCPTCHNGVAVGGSSFQKLGLVNEYPDQSDLGRYGVTKQEEDKMKFRVPSLRNIAKTGPYFHNSKFTNLDDVIKTMAFHQLGKKVTPAEIKQVKTFLNALTGELPKEYIKKPQLPKSTAETPKPENS